ncbi:MAG: hypothetical protein ACRBBR_00695 [Cellvibrionaceae bacterium]
MKIRPDGVLVIAIAVSRSGKSVWIKVVIQNDKRVLVFDPKGEYVAQMGFTACRSRVELVNTLVRSRGEAKIAYVQHDKAEFDFFCQCAFNWNRQAQATIICEELANVTNAGKAAGHWGRLVSQGLAYGPKIIGTVQRGQEVDKSVISNSTFVHVGRHSTMKDRAYIANQLGLEVSEIPDKKLEFIQWTSDRGKVVECDVGFPASRKTPVWPNGVPKFRSKGAGKKVLTVGPDARFKNIIYS